MPLRPVLVPDRSPVPPVPRDVRLVSPSRSRRPALRSRWRGVVLALAIGAVLVIALVAAIRSATSTPTGRTAPPLRSGVVYEATGDALRALVT
ncbi:hypothetical protein [Actinomycetospora straminea]|uniref:Uncharacterized protein n=1 Tax=Actinomycetospora straminea TaxID=663607 RepID=A0ABP9EIW1_9PSEU|nr:hypothetical protein [Actinomycetospora straminea]MDD7933144.1 hypothetical protein [Actinomycetospora straminea]